MKNRTYIAMGAAFLLLILPSLVYLENAKEGPQEILEKTALRDYQDLELKVRIVKVSKKGREREMELTVKMKKTPEVTKTLAEFTAPPEAKGIKALTWSYPGEEKPADRWFKLAGLEYAKCVGKACQNMEDRFGFSTSIFSMNVEDAVHELKGTEKMDGAECYKIESTSKNPDQAEGYRFVFWIDKEKYAMRKIEAYDKDGNPVSTSSFTEFKMIGDHWWEAKGEHLDQQSGKTVKFQILEAKIDQDIPDEVFEKPKLFNIEGGDKK